MESRVDYTNRNDCQKKLCLKGKFVVTHLAKTSKNKINLHMFYRFPVYVDMEVVLPILAVLIVNTY